MTIGQRIKNKRIELGLSVDELAAKLNKNRATIYRYEKDDIKDLPITVLEPLAKVLETTPADLMGWSDSSAPAATIKLYNVHCDTEEESELILSYRKLNKHNQDRVLTYSQNLLSTQQMEEDVLAAHARTDVEQTSEGVQHDLDIMNDDSEWE